MDEKTGRIIEQLRGNPAAAAQLLSGQDGQQLLQLLTAQDGGAALQQAVGNASRGNVSDLVRLLGQLMRTSEGAQVMERISKTVQK